MDSVWTISAQLPSFEMLQSDIKTDVLIIGGTSLAVYPAAGLIHYYRGNKLVLINMGATSYDDQADLVIREKIGEVFSQV